MSALDDVNSAGSDLGSAAGIYGGISRGTTPGYLRAGSNLASLLAKLGHVSPLTQYGGDLGSLAGILQGIQSGGWQGDTSAALNAGRLGLNAGVQTGALDAATAAPYLQGLGYAAIPLELYDFAKYGTKSGRTGSDAASGAETGASIGSAFAPGIGTLLGGVIGGAAGALASAFGPGAEDPENEQWNQYAAMADKNPQIAGYLSPSTAYQNLAGVMDARDNTPGHSQPIEQAFGRAGEQNLMDQLTGYVNHEYDAGAITPGESIGQQWSQTVDPWLESRGAGIANNNTVKGDPEGSALTGDLQSLLGSWESRQLTPQSAVGIDGQTIGGLQTFAGETPAEAQYWQQQAADQRAAQSEQGNQSMRGRALAARGGSMNSKSALQHVYQGSFKDRKRDFYYGGSYVDYTVPTMDLSSQNSTDLSSQSDFSPDESYYGQTDYSSPGINNPQAGGGGYDWSSLGSAASSLGQLAKNYAWMLPLIGAVTGATNSKQAQPIAPPSGMSSGPSRPYFTPDFQRQQTKMPADTDWYTYGEHPEQSFFKDNQLPYMPGFSPASEAPTPAPTPSSNPQRGDPRWAVMSEGGALDFAGGSGTHYVEGPGDGTSDDIPAKLSDGEYVMDAGTVSMLGNGSNEAGARRLDMLRENLRKHAGRSLSKGKQFMNVKAPEQYLPPAGRKPRGQK